MHEIAILGTGYVGLVTGACFAELGNSVVCIDIDVERIDGLQRGEIPFYEPGLEELVHRNVASERLFFTTDYGEGLINKDIIFLCLPTPPSSNGAADVTILRAAVARIAEIIQSSDVLVVNKSTAPVGTCQSLQRLISTVNPGLAGVQVLSNPEFLREGSAISDFMSPDRIVIGAEDRSAAERLKQVYEPIDAPVLITDTKSAEMIKYASNAFLATKISFINEIADICEKVGADVSVVAEGMGLDKRIGKAFLRPGVGYGGSCFPKDVMALAHLGAIHGADPKLLKAVMDVNTHQFRRVLFKLREQLGHIEGRTIGVWGISYKPNTDDIRESPSVEIMRLLEQEGAEIKAYDPVAMPKASRRLPNVRMCRNVYEVAEGADAVLLLTEWTEFKSIDLKRVASIMHTPIIIDGRNVLDPLKAQEAGLHYVGVGRGKVRKYGGSELDALIHPNGEWSALSSED